MFHWLDWADRASGSRAEQHTEPPPYHVTFFSPPIPSGWHSLSNSCSSNSYLSDNLPLISTRARKYQSIVWVLYRFFCGQHPYQTEWGESADPLSIYFPSTFFRTSSGKERDIEGIGPPDADSSNEWIEASRSKRRGGTGEKRNKLALWRA